MLLGDIPFEVHTVVGNQECVTIASHSLLAYRPYIACTGVNETREAYAARNEERDGEWRCPSCRTMRHEVPTVYMYVFLWRRNCVLDAYICPGAFAEGCVIPRAVD